MIRLVTSALAIALVALPLKARAAPADDELEFVGDGEAKEPADGAMPLPSAPEVDDDTPPLIEDLAVAAGNPTTPPMITAVITDDWSGVERAEIFFRAPGAAEFDKVAFSPGAGGLFIARLPDGVQKTGFEYYVEVWDAAKNGPTRMGSPEAPLPVEAAAEGTLDRLERQEREALEGPVHPGWVMLAMGTGVVASAVSGLFWIDLLNVVQPNIDVIHKDLAANPSATRRAELEKSLTTYENSRTGDLVFGAVTGVIGVAALGTGVALMIVSMSGE